MAVRIYLSELLGKRKISQAELSRKTEIRANTINELYCELVERINLDHIEKICKVLDCDIEDLLKIEK